jgi:hypothetical protein
MKKIYMSKTMWFNIILLSIAMFDRNFFETIGVSQAAIPKIEIILVKVCAIGNLILRYYSTSEKIEPINADTEKAGLAIVIGCILAV